MINSFYFHILLTLGIGVTVVMSIFSYYTIKKSVSLTQETLRQAMQVNHAVNGKIPGDTTLSEDVTSVLAEQERVALQLKALPEGGLLRLVQELKTLVLHLTKVLDQAEK